MKSGYFNTRYWVTDYWQDYYWTLFFTWLLIPDGVKWTGVWVSTRAYSTGDAVLYKTSDGSYHAFVSKTNHNAGNVPTTAYQHWTRLVQKEWVR